MPTMRPPYLPQLRARLIEQARSGRSPEDPGRQFEPSAQTIRHWLSKPIAMTAAAAPTA